MALGGQSALLISPPDTSSAGPQGGDGLDNEGPGADADSRHPIINNPPDNRIIRQGNCEPLQFRDFI
ncbi:unnamed protein product [Arctogadus glacialis]